MSLLELTFVLATTLILSVTSLGLINTQTAILHLQIQAVYLTETCGPASAVLQKLVGRAKTVQVYDTFADAQAGGTPLAPTATGTAVRLTFSDPLTPGDPNLNSYAVLNYDATSQRLVFFNSSNSNSWFVATGITACTFSLANGLLTANLQRNGQGVDLVLEQQ